MISFLYYLFRLPVEILSTKFFNILIIVILNSLINSYTIWVISQSGSLDCFVPHSPLCFFLCLVIFDQLLDIIVEQQRLRQTLNVDAETPVMLGVGFLGRRVITFVHVGYRTKSIVFLYSVIKFHISVSYLSYSIPRSHPIKTSPYSCFLLYFGSCCI